jgi:tetratricopeptide (TPR) repeat protein
MSYARQSVFDLVGARDALERAVTLDPDNALAWARLAELQLSFGKLGDALAAAKTAASLDPNLNRTQTVLGYAYLTQVKTGKAIEAFDKAIELDQGDPLARLGLGLARIRNGDLNDGIRELEVAASLDPGNSLVRSYLGKAYFERKKIGLDEREYDLAKGFDPNDPTPWFYDAIAKQTTNRPVEALRDMEEAIDLNDNRAIYRSRLLLDSDLASRSASLGRIYTDLGFQQLALVEGWNSVNTDPANYSAHRLLADSYAARPRHEIARVSELFQSQMLQPLNLITSQGPAALAFNEFNPLFNRDQVNFQGSFLGGEDETLAGEGVISGIYKKFSFSAGYSAFETDGFRENNQQEDRIGNFFAQLELSPSTSIQAEARYRKLESGDLGLRFFEDDFSEYQSETTEGTNVRIGLRQDFGPGVTLLASYMHSDKDLMFSYPEPDFLLDFNIDRNEKADSVEGQLLFRSSSVDLVGGVGYFDIDAADTTVFGIDDPFFGFTDITTSDTRIKHTNLYLYSYISLLENLNLTLGLSGDVFEEDGEFFSEFQIPGLPPFDPVPIEPPPVLGEQDQANPKAGITWRVGSGTTLRAAWFRTLKRTLITDQTLEPTQVAGFNQFFDDPSATKTEVYGAAIDQKFGKAVFGGLQYTRRELTIPRTFFQDGVDLILTENYGNERLSRAYLFAAPHPWFTISAEYNYEDIELDPELFFSFSRAKTHRVPITARFFHPSGFSALLGATYLDQEGEFKLPFADVFVPGEKDFWVADAALRYRLPKRYGFLVAGVNNLTDERSTYQATDPRNLSIRPGRVFFASVVVAFP